MNRPESMYYEQTDFTACSKDDEFYCYGGDSSNLVDRYEIRQFLGKGSMGKVKLGVDTSTREKVAIKIVKRAMPDPAPKGDARAEARARRQKEKAEIREVRTIREAHIMMLLRHPNIVRLKNLYASEDNFYMVMDYVQGGQLLHYIVARKQLAEEHARLFTRQIVSALDYLHRNSIVHRDLKIENILVDKSGLKVKIIDFGLSNLYCPERKLDTYCGSLYFAAPELLTGTPYRGPEVDVWSLGCVIYVMMCGFVPFDDQYTPGLHYKIKTARVSYPLKISEVCRNLLSKIFVVNRTKRITLQNVIRHPWLNAGYAEVVKSHIPLRKPLHPPLDPKIIHYMSKGFNVGSSRHIKEKLDLIINSSVYHRSAEYVLDIQKNHRSLLLQDIHLRPHEDPQTMIAAYHPLVSLYHLTKERALAGAKATFFKIKEQNDPPTFFKSHISPRVVRSEKSVVPEIIQDGLDQEEDLRVKARRERRYQRLEAKAALREQMIARGEQPPEDDSDDDFDMYKEDTDVEEEIGLAEDSYEKDCSDSSEDSDYDKLKNPDRFQFPINAPEKKSKLRTLIARLSCI